MASLNFNELKAEEEKLTDEQGLHLTGLDDEEIMVRPVMMLPSEDQKVVLTLSKTLNKKNTADEAMLDALDQILIAASDKKEAMKKTLAALATPSKMTIFEAWMKAADLPEASASTS